MSARARTVILLRLDALLSGGAASYDYKDITVEHVCPQSPAEGSCWETWIDDEEERDALIHTLGNLALLTRKKNSQASNYEFDKKKKTYFSIKGVSPFAITTQVLEHSTWTASIIKKRKRQLVDELSAHWRLAE